MPFTARSVANKGNLFRIGPRIDILVVVQELVTFNILQDTLMLIPAVGLQQASSGAGPLPARPGQLSASSVPERQEGGQETLPYQVELIAAKRVLASTYRADDNLLTWPYIPPGPATGVPVKILACRIKNLVPQGRLSPISPGSQALAVAYYTYEVEVIFADGTGRTGAVTLKSGPRRQRAVVCPGSGYLEVDVTVKCLGVGITSPVIPTPRPPSRYKPVRLWLGARPFSQQRA
ncbi:hypothetical protein MOTE_18840 [Moorella thermoacetica]|uniref:Uncharacterized protein n=1 Tax=Neomoorella thermoacetica TaxID=1525 RepID=A0A1J5NI41_NEOTH|nr:hypothetical protein MOTE_18840 [Moorella thermoacetica]